MENNGQGIAWISCSPYGFLEDHNLNVRGFTGKFTYKPKAQAPTNACEVPYNPQDLIHYIAIIMNSIVAMEV